MGAVPRTIDSVAWTKDDANSRGTPSSEGSKYTLTVPGLTLGDEGMYELTLTNEIGAGTPLSFSITVNCEYNRNKLTGAHWSIPFTIMTTALPRIQ